LEKEENMGDNINVENNDPGMIGRIVDGITNTSRGSYKATVTDDYGNKKVGEGNTKEEAIKNAYNG